MNDRIHSSRRLSAPEVLAVADQLEALGAVGKSDLERLRRFAKAVSEADDRAPNLERALSNVFGGDSRAPSDPLVAFRNFRSRINTSAAEHGVGFELFVDMTKSNRLTDRTSWAQGVSLVAEVAEGQMDAATDLEFGRAASRARPIRVDSAGNVEIRFFVSFAEKDAKLKDSILAHLVPALDVASPKDWKFVGWESGRDIVLGERFHDEIQEAIRQCDFGLLLLSPDFLHSDYIRTHELPHFIPERAGSVQATRKAIPVALRRIDLTWPPLEDVKEHQIFFGRNSKGEPIPFDRAKGSNPKDVFVQSLANQIVRAMEKVLGSPPDGGPPARRASPVVDGTTGGARLAGTARLAVGRARSGEESVDDAVANALYLACDGTREHHGVGGGTSDRIARARARRASLSPAEQSAHGRGPDDEEGVDALEEMLSWTKASGGPLFLALLGETGIGKTTNLQGLAKALIAERKEYGAAAARLPLFIDLRFTDMETRLKPTLEGILDSVLRQSTPVETGRLSGADAIRLVREEGALVIFDGLDEVLVHLKPMEGVQFSRQLAEILPSGVRARSHGAGDAQRRIGRVVMSCRTQYFRSVAEQFAVFQQPRDHHDEGAFKALMLLPFGEVQIREYLSLNMPGMDPDAFFALVESVHDLRDLARRPYTLKFITSQVGRLEELRAAGERVNGARLYGLMVDEWLARDFGKHTWLEDHKKLVMQNLAASLWRTGNRTWDAADLEQWMVELLVRRPDLELHYRARDIEVLKRDLRTATFVTREGDKFRFAHSSLQEYFLAGWLWEAALRDQPDAWALPLPSKETFDFLAQLIELAEPARCAEALGRLGEWGRVRRLQVNENLLALALACDALGVKGPASARLQLDSADLRVVLGRHFDPGRKRDAQFNLREATLDSARLDDLELSRIDFSGASFVGAVTDRACFERCNFRDADFSGARLQGAVFRHCVVERSRFTDAVLHRTRLIGTPHDQAIDLPEPDELCAGSAVLTDAGPMARTVDLELRSEIHGARSGLVTALAVLRDGRLASGGYDGSVRVWDAATGEATVLSGHTAEVTALAVHLNGRLASASLDGSVRVWDASTGEATVLLGHTAGVTALTVLPNGRFASGSFDGSVRVWDAATAEARVLSGHTAAVWALVVLPDGRLASGGSDGSVRVWEASTGEATALTGHTEGVWVLAVLASGRLASGSFDGSVRVWDVTSKEATVLSGHAGGVTALAALPDGRLASGSFDGSVRVWDVATGEETVLLSHTASVRNFKVSVKDLVVTLDGKLASGGNDGVLRVWDVATGEATVLSGHTGWIWALAPLSDGRLASCGSDSVVRVWDAATSEATVLSGHTVLVNAIAPLSDGRLALGGGDGVVRVWDASTGVATTLSGHTVEVTDLAALPDGRLASGSLDGSVRVWDTATGEAKLLSGHTEAVWALVALPDGRLASGGSDGSVRVWDAATGEATVLSGHTNAVLALVALPDGQLASGGNGGSVWVWDVATGGATVLSGDKDAVTALAALPDGRLASVNVDGSVRVWDVATGDVTFLSSSADVLAALAVLPDGRLASGSDDGSVRLWDTATGEATVLTGHTDGVEALAVLPDGRLASGGHDGSVRVWDTATGICERIAVLTRHGFATLSWDDAGNRHVVDSIEGDAWRALATEVRLPDGTRYLWPPEVLLRDPNAVRTLTQ